MYGALHFIPMLVFRRKIFATAPLRMTVKALLGTLRSSAFLGTFVMIYQCALSTRTHDPPLLTGLSGLAQTMFVYCISCMPCPSQGRRQMSLGSSWPVNPCGGSEASFLVCRCSWRRGSDVKSWRCTFMSRDGFSSLQHTNCSSPSVLGTCCRKAWRVRSRWSAETCLVYRQGGNEDGRAILQSVFPLTPNVVLSNAHAECPVLTLPVSCRGYGYGDGERPFVLAP